MELGTLVGPVTVVSTQGRGQSPEEVAERCLNRIVQVSNTAPEPIREQAEAFKSYIYQTLVHYMKEMVKSDRTTLCAELSKQGHENMAELIRRI